MRVLLYSHDTFGLGHVRRAAAIARILGAHDPDVCCTILTGSPLASRIPLPPCVDIVPLPPVIKAQDGSYAPPGDTETLAPVIEARRRLIQETVTTLAPDLVLVDKEACGLKGELLPALEQAHARSIPIVLGIRDVLDEPAAIRREWHRKGAVDAVRAFYTAIWVYGLADIHDPLAGLSLGADAPPEIFLGYLPRPAPRPPVADRPYLLVTPGGGGDGAGLIDWVLTAYETGADLPWPAHMVFGPFMPLDQQTDFQRRVDALPLVTATGFDPDLTGTLAGAAAVVAMGGHNTFCEILTHDKPALLVPRTAPRREQWIRAHRAADLGLAAVLDDPLEGGPGHRHPAPMVEALEDLARRSPPAAHFPPGLLDGATALADAFDAIRAPAKPLVPA